MRLTQRLTCALLLNPAQRGGAEAASTPQKHVPLAGLGWERFRLAPTSPQACTQVNEDEARAMIPRQKRVCKPHSGLSRMHVHLAMPCPPASLSPMSPSHKCHPANAKALELSSQDPVPNPAAALPVHSPLCSFLPGLSTPATSPDGCSCLPGDCQAGLFPTPIQPTHFLICTQASTCTGCCVNSPLHLQGPT